MKKKLFIILGIIILVISVSIGVCFTKDNLKFKFDYEKYNYIEYENGKKIKVKIPIDNRIKYLNEKKLIEFLDNGTGIIYFGYTTCPWCRNAIPVLISAIKENDIDTLYYVDIHSVSIKSVNEKLEEYYDTDSEGNKRMAVPTVYAVKDGEILKYHIGTVESYKNPYKGMSDEQKQELKDIYTEMIKVIK